MGIAPGVAPNAEADDEIIPVKPAMCELIRPEVRHRAIGKMTVLNFVLPKFDPADFTSQGSPGSLFNSPHLGSGV
jgi:hypothetical protein